MDFSTMFGDAGSAIGDFLQSGSDAKQATTFQQAAKLEQQNEQIAKASTGIQLAQQQRQQYMSMSGTVAEAAGNGLAAKGSVGDILRSSAQQGALARSLTREQGQINENAYAAQAGAYSGEAAAASAKSKSDTFGSILSAAGAVAAFF